MLAGFEVAPPPEPGVYSVCCIGSACVKAEGAKRASSPYASRRLSSRTLRSSLTSALGVARSLGHTSGVDGWAGVDVSAHLCVDVDKNTWVSVLVRAGE